MPFSWAVDKPIKLTPTPIELSQPVWAKPDNRIGVIRLPSLSRNNLGGAQKTDDAVMVEM